MDETRRHSKLSNLKHLNEEITSQEKILEEAARESARWEGASDEVVRTLRDLFAEICKILPRKKITFNDSNNIDGLRSQVSSARRRVREAIEALSFPGVEAANREPKLDSESIHLVFISSTFEDLRAERAEVQKAILRLGCLPIGMELFPSADDDAWNYIKREIKRCDYYVLIVGVRYGSVDIKGLSFTEKEYRLARLLKKPCVVFVRSTEAVVGPDEREPDDAKRARLGAFVAKLNNSRLAQRFDNHDQLGGDAYYSLDKLRKNRPTQGYIRATTNASDSESITLRRQYDTLLAEHQSLLERSAERPPLTPLSPEYLKLDNDYNELKKTLFTSEQSLRRCTDESASLRSQLETPTIASEPASDQEGFAFDPKLDRVRLNSGEIIALELVTSTSGILGFTVAPVNTTPNMIESYQVEVADAKSWSQKHQRFLECTAFNRKAAVSGGKLGPQSKHNGQWLIRVVGMEGGQSLTLYNDDSTLLPWPNDDPADVEIWRLTLLASCSDAPDFRAPRSVAMPPCYVDLRWDKKYSTLLIAPHEMPVEQEDQLSSTPIDPLTTAEDAVVDWIRRIHLQGKVRFQRQYPSIVATTPNGDTIGYLIASTTQGMEKLIQEAAFNNYDDLRRLCVVVISKDNREVTDAVRSMLDHQVPARVSVTIGQIENRLFVPKEEGPPQVQRRTG